MTDYIINQFIDSFAFNSKQYVIKIGASKKILEKLSDDEQIEAVADSLLHEHIHKTIFDLFNDDILCKLFDLIEHNFRTNLNLHIKFLRIQHKTPWCEWLDTHDFYEFLEHYHIDDGLYWRTVDRSRERNGDF
jgi:hypothetical protein